MRSLILGLFLVIAAGACTSPQTGPTYQIEGKALAGPTCPVEPASPLPGQCADRPVAGAVLVITDATGHEVARVATASDGSWTASVPAGTLTITPQAVPGLLGTARPVSVTVGADTHPSGIQIAYDTGIR